MDRPVSLARCLEAILGGTMLPSTVVVVDQSTLGDETRHVVDEARGRVSAPCRFVHHPSTGGMARGQNQGMALVDEPVVLVTDDDCVPAPDWVKTAWDAFAETPDLGLVGGRVLPQGPPSAGLLPVASRTGTEAVEVDHRTDPWRLGSGNNFAVRRELWLAVGGNDERLGPGAPLRGAADIDLFRRLLRSGARGRYEPRLVVHHEQASRADRRRRRVPYGYGMGVAAALWWRQGDRQAATIARHYLAMRVRRARAALRRRHLDDVWDEALVLSGLVRGTVRGLTLTDPAPAQGQGRA